MSQHGLSPGHIFRSIAVEKRARLLGFIVQKILKFARYHTGEPPLPLRQSICKIWQSGYLVNRGQGLHTARQPLTVGCHQTRDRSLASGRKQPAQGGRVHKWQIAGKRQNGRIAELFSPAQSRLQARRGANPLHGVKNTRIPLTWSIRAAGNKTGGQKGKQQRRGIGYCYPC